MKPAMSSPALHSVPKRTAYFQSLGLESVATTLITTSSAAGVLGWVNIRPVSVEC
jgi:hypothetical protein